MKKYNLALAFVAGLSVLASCTMSDELPTNDEKIATTFGAALESTGTTRTIVSGMDETTGAGSVAWVKGDKLSVFLAGKSGDTFTCTQVQSPTNNGTFEGKTYTSGPYYLLYPAQDRAKVDANGQFFLNIPNNQIAKSGSFDPNANIQIAKAASWSGSITLSNVCAYFVVKVDAGCTGINVKAMKMDNGKAVANPDWYLAGDVYVPDPTSASTAIKDFGTCQSEISLTGNELSKGGYFLIAFIPTSKGPCLQVTSIYGAKTHPVIFNPQNNADGSTGSFYFAAGTVYSLGHFTYDSTTETCSWVDEMNTKN